jgi:hypothetical protein
VGDQGVKAAIATPPPSTNVAFGEVRHGLQGAPRNALENVAAGTAKPFASIKPDDARLSLVTSSLPTASIPRSRCSTTWHPSPPDS